MKKENRSHNSENYSYKEKIKNWRNYATRNKIPFDCEKCHKTHAYKTIYLDTGAHICWYCWIRKDNQFDNVVQKPIEIVKTEVVKKTKPKVKIIERNISKKIDSTPKVIVNKKPKVTPKSKTIKKEEPLLKKKNINENINLKLMPKVHAVYKVDDKKENTNVSDENYYDNIKHRFYGAYSKKQIKKGDKNG